MTELPRLHPQAIHLLPREVSTPEYDRASVGVGIVHLGVGAFHRAHQAWYTEAAMNCSGGDWGIVGVSMRSNTVAQQLNPQEGLYSVLSEDGSGRRLQVVGALTRVLVAPEEPGAVDRALADPNVHVVTLTITEKGYCLAGDGRSLDIADEQVAHDLEHPLAAQSAIGVLARGLACRQAAGGAPLTVISCDNLAENSRKLHAALVAFLQHTAPDVLPWLERAVSFPCSMIDRIVPASTAAGRERQAQMLGLEDQAAVTTEPFTQWIIEDDFASDMPDWPAVGVQLVTDIRPFEAIKLQLLNASHSAIACLGLLSGRETVADVVTDPVLGKFVARLMAADLMPALDVPAGFDLAGYRDQLLARFANPCLRHRCAQIAMDASQKIPVRWLPVLRKGATPNRYLLTALALWCDAILERDVALDDPLHDELLQLRHSAGELPARLGRLLGLLGMQDTESESDKLSMQVVEQQVMSLQRVGLNAMLEATLDQAGYGG